VHPHIAGASEPVVRPPEVSVFADLQFLVRRLQAHHLSPQGGEGVGEEMDVGLGAVKQGRATDDAASQLHRDFHAQLRHRSLALLVGPDARPLRPAPVRPLALDNGLDACPEQRGLSGSLFQQREASQGERQ
jgi:hypothetical protein